MVSTVLTADDVANVKQPKKSYSKAYATLKKQVKAKGLLDKDPTRYIYILIEPIVMLAACITILVVFHDKLWIQLLNCFLWSLTSVRSGFIMHDTGHRGIFKKIRTNDLVGLFYSNLILGSSISSWRMRHNEHHAFTNEIGIDPTLEIPVWAWIEEQAADKSGLLRFIMKYQAYTFFPVLSMSAFFQAYAAIRDVFFVRRKVQDRILQGLFLILHHTLYFALLFIVLPVWWQALLIFFVHHIILGLHLGLVFAPNHKGMPVVNPDHGMDFVYVQALTTRNIRPNPVVDYFYGALNYQIEHHFFPTLGRHHMPECQRITQAFCEENDIPYYETGVIESYREILDYMNEICAPLREQDRKKTA